MAFAFNEDAPLYAVGQVAEMLGVQPAFLRRLDVEKVVQPARSTGQQRRYTRAEIAQVQRVSEMAAAGMSLPGIRRILELEVVIADLRHQLDELRPRPTVDDDERPTKAIKDA